jgi:hypothetical protein
MCIIEVHFGEYSKHVHALVVLCRATPTLVMSCREVLPPFDFSNFCGRLNKNRLLHRKLLNAKAVMRNVEKLWRIRIDADHIWVL